MERKLPEGWKECRIGEIFNFVGGGTPSKSNPNFWNGEISWASIKDIKGSHLLETKDKITLNGLKSSASNLAKVGEVIIATRISPGKAIITKIETAINQDLKIVKPKIKIINGYVYYLFTVIEEKIASLSSGTTVKGITLEKLNDITIPLPPLAEQERIVARLDALFAGVARVRERLERVPTLLRQFRQSVLARAVSGELTADWRAESFQNWEIVKFKEIAEVKSNLVSPANFPDLPLIAPDNIERDTGKLINYSTVEESKAISPKHYFYPGQIIYSKIRPYLNKLIIANFEGLCSADMYPIETTLNVKYLFYFMLSKNFNEQTSNAGSRTVLPKINQKELGEILVPLPPLAEQQEIVRRVEALFAVADRLEAHYDALWERVEQLPRSVLARAFRGELVPQEADAISLTDS